MAKAAKPKLTAKEKLERLLSSKATVAPDELHQHGAGQLGGRNAIYDACARGEIENFRVGKRIYIPTAPLRRKLGMEAA
jgi:hypothetical protein